MTWALVPRPFTSQVCAPSTSSQTRTQRWQSTQRLLSRAKRGCEASISRAGHLVGEAHVVHTHRVAEVLQLAVAVHHADRADVVALREEQLHDRAPVALEALGVGGDDHPLLDPASCRRAASLAEPCDLDHAQPAGADLAEALEVAQARDGDALLVADVEDGLVLARAHQACR